MGRKTDSNELEEQLKAVESTFSSVSIAGATDTAATKALVTVGRIILRLDRSSRLLALVNILLTVAILVATVLGIIVTWFKH